jgi:N-acetylglucosamine kinase-like BadF-type ATPase
MAELIPPRRDQFLTADGLPTVRFAEYLEALARQGNSVSSQLVEAANSNAAALLFALENRIGSGDFLLSDETGFTVDSDLLSVDMHEA